MYRLPPQCQAAPLPQVHLHRQQMYRACLPRRTRWTRNRAVAEWQRLPHQPLQFRRCHGICASCRCAGVRPLPGRFLPSARSGGPTPAQAPALPLRAGHSLRRHKAAVHRRLDHQLQASPWNPIWAKTRLHRHIPVDIGRTCLGSLAIFEAGFFATFLISLSSLLEGFAIL